ncbi:MAG: GNAT family N-acetyltransferase [Clostridia bacterium]|nr:GNAT family N-acetyltransferase [Clostridia bacterium]
MIVITPERLSAEEYIEFLGRTDLGSQYPAERFDARIAKLVKNVPISLTAREDGRLVGVLFGITDFAYWLFVTDLGVDREHVGRGIGRRLMEAALEAAGGKDDIIVYTCANENAVGFYEKLGMRPASDAMVYNHVQWTDFTVGRDRHEKA